MIAIIFRWSARERTNIARPILLKLTLLLSFPGFFDFIEAFSMNVDP